jgi:hypothetical protein
VYKKTHPKWEISSNSDIPQNLGYARQIRSLLVCAGQNIIFESKFMLPGGASYRPSLKWLAHKTFKLKLGYYSTGYKYERCLINCQSFPRNGAY